MEKRDLTVTGLCSVYHLKQVLLVNTEKEAFNKIMKSAEQIASLPAYLTWRGKSALRWGEYDPAIKNFNKAIQLDPDDPDAFYRRGLAWSAKKEYDKAIKDYEEAIRLRPDDADFFNDRGLAWSEKKAYDKAIKDYDEAIRLDPNSASAFINRGDAWSRKKEYGKAIKDYNVAIRLRPDNAYAFSRRGLAWGDRKEYDKAIKDFDEAIHLDPKDAYAFYCRSLAWSAKKEYDKAIKDCNEAIRLNPKDGWAHYYRSIAQLLDRRPKACDGFRAVLDLQGWKNELSPYAVVLGHLAARQAGDKVAAKRFLSESAGKLDQTWPYPVVQFLRGDIDEAALLKLSSDDDKRTEARCFLGMDHAIKGHNGEALAHFRWVKEHGNTAYTEYTIAAAELERLERAADGPKR
jgi:tetratricopeptide (TPR) repeat protein